MKIVTENLRDCSRSVYCSARKKPAKSGLTQLITYIITFPLPCSQVPQLCTPGRHPPHIGDKPSRPQAQGRAIPGAYRKRVRFKSDSGPPTYLKGEDKFDNLPSQIQTVSARKAQ